MRVPSLKKESDVNKRLRANATKFLPGVFIRKIHSGIYSGNVGFPDLLFIYAGCNLYLEVKSKSKLTKNQIVTIKQMRANKANVWVVRPVSFPIFSFKSPLPDGKVLDLYYDITNCETWEDLLKGPDRDPTEFRAVIKVNITKELG